MRRSYLTNAAAVLVLAGGILSNNGADPALYLESGGVVAIEAEHFSSRMDEPDDPNHSWRIVPEEDPGEAEYINARGNAYIQALPNTGANFNTPDKNFSTPWVDYYVEINTPGIYRLWLRWGGHSEDSDSMYAEVLELKDGVGGSIADWYRFVKSINDVDLSNNDFDRGWDGAAGVESNSATGAAVPAVWDVRYPGVYTIRLHMREDAAAVDTVVLQLNSLADPANPGPAESASVNSFVRLTQQPVSVGVNPGQTATFTVVAEGTGTITYQWQSKAPGAAAFTDITGAASASYTTPPATPAISGTQYRVVVSNGTRSLNSYPATLVADSTPPIIMSLVSGPFPNVLTLTFDDVVDAESAAVLTNYSVNGLTVNSATVAGNRVFLNTSPQTEGTEYTLTVSGVKDLIGNILNSATKTFRPAVAVPGSLRVDLFRALSGTLVEFLTNSTKYPYLPDETIYWTNFGIANQENLGDNYGAIISGFVLPPTTGDYKFFLRSDDSSELYLSTNRDPANLRLIAQQPGCCNEFDPTEGTEEEPSLASIPIHLVGGEKYFVMALLKEGGVNDFIQVGWRTPNDPDINDVTDLQPITGEFIALAQDPNRPPTISITSPTNFTKLPANQAATVTVQAEDPEGSVAKVEYFVNGLKLIETTTAPYTVVLPAVQAITGRYVLTAQVTDAAGVTAMSAPVAVQIGDVPDFILFVTATSGPTASDQALIDHLKSFGYILNVVGDTASLPSDASFASAIVVSSSVGSGNVGNKFQNLPFPVVFWEQGLEDNFHMTLDQDGVTRGTTGGQTQLDIVNSAHPLAAGLSGTVTVADTATDFSWGIPGTNAVIIARVPGSADHAAIYGFDKGSILIDGSVAPERRTYLFMTDNSYIALNANGRKLVDAGFSWTIGKALGGGDRPTITIQRTGTQLTITWTIGGTLESSDTVSGPWISTGDTDQSFTVDLSTATGARKFYRVSK